MGPFGAWFLCSGTWFNESLVDSGITDFEAMLVVKIRQSKQWYNARDGVVTDDVTLTQQVVLLVVVEVSSGDRKVPSQPRLWNAKSYRDVE